MKKFVLILSALFSVSCAHNAKYDKEFKNPVFNQPLEPMSVHEGMAYLSPTKVDFRRPLDKESIFAIGKCDLLENEQDRITLKCKLTVYDRYNMPTSETYIQYCTYTVKKQFSSDCLIIEEKTGNTPGESLDAVSYCVKG